MSTITPPNPADERLESAKRPIRFDVIPFRKIKREHPSVESLRQKMVGLLRDLPADAFTSEGLVAMAQHTLLHVVPKGDDYECIGNLRLYRMLKSDDFIDDDLPVVVHQRIGRKRLERMILLDLLIVPVFYSLDQKDRTRMNSAWENDNFAGLISQVVRPVVSPRGKKMLPLARILNCDVRTLEGRHAKARKRTAPREEGADSKRQSRPKATASEGHSDPEAAEPRQAGAA